MNFKYLLLLTRPVNFIITFLTAFVAVLIADSGYTASAIYFLTAFSAAVTASAGNIINDIYDIEIDKINRPERPLASGKIPTFLATGLYMAFVFSSLIAAFYINLAAVIIVSTVHIILRFYSSHLKKVPLAGNITVALLTALVFIYGGAAAGNIQNSYIPAVFAFLINFIREILKDIEDIKGDKSQGINTFPVIAGIKRSKDIIFSLTLILILFTFHPFIYNYYKVEYFIIIMITVNPLLVYFLKSLYSDDSLMNLAKISSLLKINMLFGLAAIYLGR